MKVESMLRAKGSSVITIQPWATVEQAISHLVGPPKIGAVVVTGVPRGYTGIISERDVVREMRRHGIGLLQMPVSEVMTQHVPHCAPGDSVSEVMVQMTRTRHRHLPVLSDGELIGVISIGDVVRARLDEMELEAGVLRDLYMARH